MQYLPYSKFTYLIAPLSTTSVKTQKLGEVFEFLHILKDLLDLEYCTWYKKNKIFHQDHEDITIRKFLPLIAMTSAGIVSAISSFDQAINYLHYSLG